MSAAAFVIVVVMMVPAATTFTFSVVVMVMPATATATFFSVHIVYNVLNFFVGSLAIFDDLALETQFFTGQRMIKIHFHLVF